MLDFFRAVPKKRKVRILAKNGLIYHNPSIIKKSVFYGGSYLLIVSLGYLLYLYWPLGKALIEFKYSPKIAIIDKNVETRYTETALKDNGFYIHIPKIGADAKVVSNVDPFRKEIYLKTLEQNQVAMADTSSPPGGGIGTSTYIFAHSTQQGLVATRNNAVFYLLGKLASDDVVYINYKGQLFKYKVYDKKVISAADIQYLTFKDEGKEILILQTCWPIGTDWRRLLVFGERVLE